MTPREEFERFVQWLADNGVSLYAVGFGYRSPTPVADTRRLADAYERDRASDAAKVAGS